MSETQTSINQWADSVFGQTADARAAFRRARDEMFEFIDTYSDLTCGCHEPVITEAADVVITLCRLAAVLGLDLHAEIDRKMAVNRSRRWIAHGDGTGHHIKESGYDAS